MIADTMLEPTAATKILANTLLEHFYECLEEPAVTAEDEIGAEKKTVAVVVAAESELEAAVARREQAANLLCWKQYLGATIEAEMAAAAQGHAQGGLEAAATEAARGDGSSSAGRPGGSS